MYYNKHAKNPSVETETWRYYDNMLIHISICREGGREERREGKWNCKVMLSGLIVVFKNVCIH